MKIRRLCCNNFGIIRHQIMDDIHPGLVIIAGPNRAGKTTLMMALRYLGYGLPKKDFIPSPLAGQHDYNADLELADKSRYNIHILGNSKPKVSPLGTYPAREVEDIFHNLDAFTYRQIFTISLDELRHIPTGLDTSEKEGLQVVLLGGGWGDALRLAKLEREFVEKAENIGGTRGSKNVYKFKPYYEIIQEGIAARNEANQELDSYYSKLEELTELKEEIIPRLEENLRRGEAEKKTLEVIKDHYVQYEEMLLLESKLEQEKDLLASYPEDGLTKGIELQKKYADCLDEYEKSQRDFILTAGMEEPDLYLHKQNTLASYERNLSGWREKLATYRERNQRHQEEERDLKDRLAQLYAPWGDDLSILEKIATDGVQKEKLRQDVEKHKKTLEQMEQLSSQKIQIQDSLDPKQKERIQFLEKNKVGRPGSLPLITALSLTAVLLISLFSPLSALAAGFVLGAAIYIHSQSLRLKEQEYKNQLSSLDTSIKELERQLILLEGERKSYQETLKTTEDRLNKTLIHLGLPAKIPYQQLMDFHREVVNLKDRYNPWLQEGKRLVDLHRELGNIFAEITLTLKSLNLELAAGNKDLSASQEIFALVEEAIAHLSLARKLEKARVDKENLEKKITELLPRESPPGQLPLDISPAELTQRLGSFIARGRRHQELKKEEELRAALDLNLKTSLSIGRRKEILLPDQAEKDVLSAYAEYFDTYSSLAEVEAEYERLTTELKNWGQQKEEKIQEIAVLEKEIQDLSSDEKLQAAQGKIIKAQNSLEILAEEYATYRLAEFLVREAHRVFVEGSKGSVLDSASKIFTEITAGDYSKIDIPATPGEANLAPDFAVRQAGTKDPLPTPRLSRATKEQLFLSVRLSRILNMKPLPVIFDDSLVNFDPQHSRQTARLIATLAETRQVFILTCHPEFIHHLEHYAPTSQCWGLDRGKIKGPYIDHKEAVNLLKP
ncbi:MAG: AAA family ATPase [Firmicutes bacterium]|nr:AAA family ATPase [Bacillota bacterium]